jgi:hypothetical protein
MVSKRVNSMSCCGQKRQALRTQPYQAPVPRPRPGLENPTPITYLGEANFVTKGAATGFTYLFARHEALNVDARDVAALVAMGIFTAAAHQGD